MLRKRSSLGLLAAVLGIAVFIPNAQPASAQEYALTLGLSGGVAGSFDEDEAGFSNPTFQGRFTLEMESMRNVAVRLGRMDFGEERLSLATDVTIDYIGVAGEYLFSEVGHESGFFLGLAIYDLGGTQIDGTSADESGLGLMIGAVGEFDTSARTFIFIDVVAHWAGLDAAQIFGTLQVGFGFRF